MIPSGKALCTPIFQIGVQSAFIQSLKASAWIITSNLSNTMANSTNPKPENSPAETPQTPVRARLKAGLTTAMKTRQSAIVSILRTVLAAIDNAAAVELPPNFVPVMGQSNDVPRKVLTETQMRDIVRNEIAALQSASAEYEQLGKTEEADTLRIQAAALSEYL